VEVSMPVVHPADIWQKTGRYEAIDASLARFHDRTDRSMVLAMTHEEVVGSLAAKEISSYKQLPKLIYQIQTKFRDELRSRGGLIRVREFRMKDSYSMDSSWEGLQAQYEAHYDAYFRMMARLGLPVAAVKSDVGMMGGRMAHEFMYLSPIGEDSIFICSASGKKANKEVAQIGKAKPAAAEAKALEKVLTPGVKTIQDLAAFLEVPTSETAKAVFFWASHQDWESDRLVIAMVRGDLDVNEVAVKNRIQVEHMRVAQEEEIRAVGCVPGFASPYQIDREKTIVIIDDLVAETPNLVGGANETDYHFLNMNHGRDFEADIVADITEVYDQASSPYGGTWQLYRGVEVGNIFQLGTKYTEAFDAHFMDEGGRPQPIIMGSYGIGVGRLLACLAEEYHDEHGLMWPVSVAPYEIQLVSLADGEATIEAAEQLYDRLVQAGFEVLYDDRPKKVAGPGVKFKDADLRGMPIRLTVSSKTLAENAVEFKLRAGTERRMVPMGEIEATLAQARAGLWHSLEKGLAGAETWA
ncbi:MAG: proline--tRNA ligase, partial [Bacteroidota bacterium]